MITEFVAACIAVVAGISPSMGWNAANRLPLMVLPILLQTTEEQTPTYTEHLRLEVTATEFPREQFAWESTLENAWEGELLLLLPDGTL